MQQRLIIVHDHGLADLFSAQVVLGGLQPHEDLSRGDMRHLAGRGGRDVLEGIGSAQRAVRREDELLAAEARGEVIHVAIALQAAAIQG
ncbi:MAG: hypothetical protein IPJ85_12990 [Flavobacteriales bacterium]|nr:hypothetical protein [Flavobacteriales bacterium]